MLILQYGLDAIFGPSYSETMGPMSDGRIEAPGSAINSVKIISEAVDMKLGKMFEVSEISISLLFIQPNVETDPRFRDITLYESEIKPISCAKDYF